MVSVCLPQGTDPTVIGCHDFTFQLLLIRICSKDTAKSWNTETSLLQ